MTRKRESSSLKICVADLSGIQRIYFWIPDIPPAAEFRNDETAGAKMGLLQPEFYWIPAFAGMTKVAGCNKNGDRKIAIFNNQSLLN
ncbi:MAG: hypothetical protein A3C55_06095 [Gammaproteobacteria bacterium RIFCSPHIGHO2_02_FULL_42_13]|nr:MAG: hypothetical protein A3C55_06095 [Gammaproteobacteria bacterium RIFCSPHIGHO2_02_FULL_42_13]OGT67720.1 MAG: hypothetical protein A3H43_04425 [Gammaproteobacteria bacterium RIFCSPLOWO2_02_FULL_42_9]